MLERIPFGGIMEESKGECSRKEDILGLPYRRYLVSATAEYMTRSNFPVAGAKAQSPISTVQ